MMIRIPVLYPILFGVYPILALWANNFGKVQPTDVVRSLSFSFLASILLYLVCWLIIQSPSKAALMSTMLILLFFTYGHIYGLLEKRLFLGVQIGRHRNMIFLWLLLIGVGTFLILKYGAHAKGLNQFLNTVGILLLVFLIGQLVYFQIRSSENATNLEASQNNLAFQGPAAKVDPQNSPDVYYIILDAYTRADVLQQDYNFDNTAFLRQLTDLGFVIPPCAQSNYSYTLLSMAATLNMNYLDVLDSSLNSKTTVDYPLYGEFIHHSLVRKIFNELGYKFVTFKTINKWIDIQDSDIYIQENNANLITSLLESNDFDAMLNETTAWKIMEDLQTISPFLAEQLSTVQNYLNKIAESLSKDVRDANKARYDIIINDLNKIDSVSKLPGRKFVYMHVQAPHLPGVLGKQGEYLPIDDSVVGYTNGVSYLDQRMIPIIKTILANSKIPPVIILQGDHGWGLSEETRNNILNAYYLPGDGAKKFYSTITPVNTFRIILNSYFGGNFSILEDKSYFSPNSDRINFKIVPSNCTK
jgi:hypothetical protein